MYDIVIENGKILDGTGNPWFYGNIGVLNGKIKLLPRGYQVKSKTTIDALGKYVAPGFIDIHTHADFTVLPNPLLESTIQQGVTTAIGGNCGFSMAPLKPHLLEELKKFLSFVPVDLDWNWASLEEFLSLVASQGVAINFGTFIGQGILRIISMGFDRREATHEELHVMKHQLGLALDQGALGMSMGLVYAPGSFATKEELGELAKVLSKRNKILAAHLRDEADGVLESLVEVLDVAENTGVALQISHLKAAGQANWGKMKELIKTIEAYRQRGVDVTFDVYPYNALNTLLMAILPEWAQEGGIDKVLHRLKDEKVRGRLKNELAENGLKYGGWENIVIASVHNPSLSSTVGMTFTDLAAKYKLNAEEVMVEMLLEDKCSTMVISYNMKEDNVEMGLKHPLSMLGSDSQSLANHGKLAQGKPHPRNFGTFPRFITEFVRERKVISLADAVRKMTSAPAKRLGLNNRGMIQDGFAADLVIFDLQEIKDRATFDNPVQYPEGIYKVIVNGKVALDKGRQKDSLNGVVLK